MRWSQRREKRALEPNFAAKVVSKMWSKDAGKVPTHLNRLIHYQSSMRETAEATEAAEAAQEHGRLLRCV